MQINQVGRFQVGRFLARGGAILVATAAMALAACSASEGSGGGELEIAQTEDAITTWATLSLRNGWKAASNSVTPSVGRVNGIVTFRGALDGSKATSRTAFCLGSSTFDNYRITDVGVFPVRVAMANGSNGSMIIDFPLNPDTPAADRYCASFQQDGTAAQPGANAKIRTSLDGVSYDRTFSDSKYIPYNDGWGSPYPYRGSDSNAHAEGQGMFAKLVNGFVRFQAGTAGGSLSPSTLFTLPDGQGMRPGNTVYLTTSLCGGLGGTGRIAVRTNGNVDVVGLDSNSQCGVHLDGLSFSMSSPASAKAIGFSNNWIAHSSRAVRARNDNGVIRLEGAVKNGTTATIGTLPTGMWPANTVTLFAAATSSSLTAQISINNSGVITLIKPSLAIAQQGLSLDGVSFHP